MLLLMTVVLCLGPQLDLWVLFISFGAIDSI